MKRKVKFFIAIMIITIGILILQTNKVHAALQSNGGAVATKNVSGWLTSIRQMQATGGTLGLTDTINGTNLTSGNKNLDIHMEKNTEYGAMVLLSASAYGNPGKITASGQTTTGNVTGVVMNINKEWVAAGKTNTVITAMANAAGRYKNLYTAPTYTEKSGDALATGAWHGNGATKWMTSINNNEALPYCGLLRSYNVSVFSYYGYSWTKANYSHDFGVGDPYFEKDNAADAYHTKTWASRAAVVVGSGI